LISVASVLEDPVRVNLATSSLLLSQPCLGATYGVCDVRIE
jgi:hypothetical protein